ncbi:hypothetical protein BX659_14621 [Orenia metallireducens]|jgi:hypothetical protein|uniref:Uncharacterized protein n=1 Tax=Orenia metallireducens TaxID=1413210 RepID=A0A285IGS5_9FIRM|nr:hypothetical protein [Orenia metallireducens]PRX18115.1 hypothetical protein BX659_14621 [Orenia metallireducens]SNY47123.1 hypothetical protein SAMN06265827_14721 [Orenia metallireducens]
MDKVAEVDMLIERYKSKINEAGASKIVKMVCRHKIKDLDIYKDKLLKNKSYYIEN